MCRKAVGRNWAADGAELGREAADVVRDRLSSLPQRRRMWCVMAPQGLAW